VTPEHEAVEIDSPYLKKGPQIPPGTVAPNCFQYSLSLSPLLFKPNSDTGSIRQIPYP
jgi:hypothetical protein